MSRNRFRVLADRIASVIERRRLRREAKKLGRQMVRSEPRGRLSFSSAGGTEGRPDSTPCPGCHGHVRHFGECAYRTIPMSDITSLTMPQAKLKRLLDERLQRGG